MGIGATQLLHDQLNAMFHLLLVGVASFFDVAHRYAVGTEENMALTGVGQLFQLCSDQIGHGFNIARSGIPRRDQGVANLSKLWIFLPDLF